MPTTGRVQWDQDTERLFETGVDRGVLYVKSGADYGAGVAWNGLTAVNEKPSGAEANAKYADNIKYLNLYSNEEFGATIEAFTYPEEFAECDGSKSVVSGVYVHQQRRKSFGFAYRTLVGNDEEDTDFGYKLHIVYGCMAAPSERNNQTVNESPEAMAFSWEVTTTPVQINIAGYKPSAHIEIDTTRLTQAQKTQLAALEDILYGKDASSGSEAVAPRLPLPAEVFTTMGYTPPAG